MGHLSSNGSPRRLHGLGTVPYLDNGADLLPAHRTVFKRTDGRRAASRMEKEGGGVKTVDR